MLTVAHNPSLKFQDHDPDRGLKLLQVDKIGEIMNIIQYSVINNRIGDNMVHKDDLNFRSITKKENKNQDHHYIVNDDQDRFIEICKPFRIQFKTEF